MSIKDHQNYDKTLLNSHACVCILNTHAHADTHPHTSTHIAMFRKCSSGLQYALFPGAARRHTTGYRSVCWNTVSSSAQLQYSRNIVLLCGYFPRPALTFTLLHQTPSCLIVTASFSVSFHFFGACGERSSTVQSKRMLQK